MTASLLTGQSALQNAYILLGGGETIRHEIVTPLDAHDLILGGIPAKAVIHMLDHLDILDSRHLLSNVVGISLRTLQRHKSNQETCLSSEQSNRAWLFAKLLAKASVVLGSQEAAESWMISQAYGLENRRPIDLLASSEGADIVDELLTRMEYGVYA